MQQKDGITDKSTINDLVLLRSRIRYCISLRSDHYRLLSFLLFNIVILLGATVFCFTDGYDTYDTSMALLLLLFWNVIMINFVN
jgi:hypothetical protein